MSSSSITNCFVIATTRLVTKIFLALFISFTGKEKKKKMNNHSFDSYHLQTNSIRRISCFKQGKSNIL